MTAPALSTAELRARYSALGKIVEHPGERTWRTRCAAFDEFLEFGPLIASDIAGMRIRAASKNPDDWPESAADMLAWHEKDHPGLFALITEAWPDAEPRD